MDAKTEELLWTLLWACEITLRPTFRNLTDTFESWAYRNGFHRQLYRLETRQLLESHRTGTGDRLHRLTEAGRLHVLGGRDPQVWWNRKWDGRWRLVIFDVPEGRRATRDRLRHWLQNRGFGYLQNSVWVTPDPVKEERALLSDGPADVESLILLDARPCAGEKDEEIVSGAWDFVEINRRYAEHQKVLACRPRGHLRGKVEATGFRRWLREERLAWLNAMELDPLLPSRLLPAQYAGREAWQVRQREMANAGRQIRSFRDE